MHRRGLALGSTVRRVLTRALRGSWKGVRRRCLERPLGEYDPLSVEAIFALRNVLFSEIIFKDPPKRPFRTSTKITSRGYFYFLRLFFCLTRLFLKITSKDS